MALEKMPSEMPNTNSTVRNAINGSPMEKNCRWKMPVASSNITMTPMMLVTTLVITSPAMYSAIDRGEANRFKKLRDQTSSRNAVVMPCMMRVQKSHNNTPPSSVGTKSMPPPLTVLR
jgi:hypothetical protein